MPPYSRILIWVIWLLLSVNTSGQLGTTQLPAHLLPTPVGWGKRKGILQARKLGGQDKKHCLIGEG